MSPTLKRILIIVGFLAAAGLIGFGLFVMFKKSTPITPPLPQGTRSTSTLPISSERASVTGTTGQIPGSGGLPTAGIIPTPNNQNYYRPEPVTQITADYAVFTSLNNNGSWRYHNESDGKFYRANVDGALSAMSDQVFYNVEKVTWANSQDKAVIEYPDGNKIVYNFEQKKQVTLPKHWEDFSFSPDGNDLAAKSLGLSPESKWLITTKDDGTGTKLIEHIGNNADKVMVNWSPSRQTVAFALTGEPQGADRREVLLLGANKENFKSLIVEGLNFDPQWSPTGQKLIYSVDSERSDFKPELWVVNSFGDAIGNNRQSLQINTWAHKCTFASDDTLYCAIPRDLPIGAGMAPEVARDTFDDLYKIDLKTGLKTGLPLGREVTIDSLSYDKNRHKIIFTDQRQSGAYEVNL